MTYNPNIPQPGDILSNSQGDFLNNFGAINTLYGINHYPFSPSTANNGKHKYIDMVAQSMPTIVSGDAAIYAGSGGQTQLFGTTDGGGNVYQLTKFIDAQFSKFASNGVYGSPPSGFTQQGGWTFLPGGLLLQYGLYGKSGALGTTGTIQFPVTFSASAYSVNATLIRSSSNSHAVSYASTAAAASFTFQTDTNGSDFVYWQAIGAG